MVFPFETIYHPKLFTYLSRSREERRVIFDEFVVEVLVTRLIRNIVRRGYFGACDKSDYREIKFAQHEKFNNRNMWNIALLVIWYVWRHICIRWYIACASGVKRNGMPSAGKILYTDGNSVTRRNISINDKYYVNHAIYLILDTLYTRFVARRNHFSRKLYRLISSAIKLEHAFKPDCLI